jgi:hypothetical protein
MVFIIHQLNQNGWNQDVRQNLFMIWLEQKEYSWIKRFWNTFSELSALVRVRKFLDNMKKFTQNKL